jgi:hypothetical protein
MATVTVDTIHSGAAATAASNNARRGLLGTLKAIYQAIIDAQDLRARTYLYGYLSHLSDEELQRLGMTRDEMVRRTRTLMSQG